ncbi:hypothetical protein FRC03_011002 [Tulasnella sp. 419]|nr:hypothetical protein FRC03_011002 [Tulasnella sp. 419]
MAKVATGNILSLLSPSPAQFQPVEYDGLEYRWGNFVVRPATFKFEGMILGLAFLYYLLSYVGASINKRKVTAWVKAHSGLYESQFAYSGVSQGANADGSTDYFLYSTGRKGVAYLHTIFAMLPRHDLAQVLFQFAQSLIYLEYAPKDDITLDFTLAPSVTPTAQGFVWGIVHKNEITTMRKNRWDLLFFTKQSENAALPHNAVVMSESADLTDLVLKSPAGAAVASLLSKPEINKHFRGLIISDQPGARPTNGPVPAEKKERHVYLSLTGGSESEMKDTEPLVRAIFNLVDFLVAKPAMRPDTAKKLAKTRDELDATLLKESKEPTAEEKEEAEEAKRAAKRKAEEEKFNAMTPAQQRKYEEKERKRSQRGAQRIMRK